MRNVRAWVWITAWGLCIGCEPTSFLRGVVRTPVVDRCPSGTQEQAVVDARVQLDCPNPDEQSPVRNPTRSDEHGAFEFEMEAFNRFSGCKVKITKEGYRSVDATLSELNAHPGAGERDRRVEVVLQRVPTQ